MTDSLGRLILRAQGRLPVAAPLLASRYSDAVSPAVPGEDISETIAAGKPAAPLRPGLVVPESPADERAGEAAPPRIRDEAMQPPAQPRAPFGPTGIARHSEQSPTEFEAWAGAPIPVIGRGHLVPPRGVGASTNAPGDLASAGPSLVETVRREPARLEQDLSSRRAAPDQGLLPVLHSREQRSRTAATMGQDRAADPAPKPAVAQHATVPEVRISIGRVEVHAAQPPVVAVPAPRAMARPRPTVSLTDYLAEKARTR